jgi:hypothetical protein
MRDFFGKYRGTVTNNKDPRSLGRVQVEVPAVLGDGRQSWAMPCVPYAGPKVGFFAIPPVGANVWVEFEGGDPDYPIWSGCFWGENEVPAQPAAPEVKVFKTEGITLTMSSLGDKKGLSLEVADPVVPKPLKIEMNADGIQLSNNGKTMAKLTAEHIELTNNEQAKVRLTGEDIELISEPVQAKLRSKDKKIELIHGSSTVTLAADNVEIKQGVAVVKLSGSGIELTQSPAAVKLSASGVEMSGGPAKVAVATANIELSHGLGNVKVAPAGVNINNGALEVT